MNNKKDNIDFWLGRIFILCCVLFILSFSSSDKNSPTETSAISNVQIEDVEVVAVTVESVRFVVADNSLVKSIRSDFVLPKKKLDQRISSIVLNQQIKNQELIFFRFKPTLLEYCVIHKKISSDKDYALIS